MSRLITTLKSLASIAIQPVPVLSLLIVAHLVVMPLMWRRVSLLERQVALLSGTGATTAAASQTATYTKLASPPKAGDHLLSGRRDAKVLLIEYSDTECPFCKEFQSSLNQAAQTYGDRIGWLYRPF